MYIHPSACTNVYVPGHFTTHLQIFIHSLTPHTAGKTPAKKVDNGSPHTECPSAGKHMYTLCACTYVYVE